MGAVVLLLIYIFFPFSCVFFFGNMIKSDTQTLTFEFKSLEEKSQSFLRFYLSMEEESHVFFSF